MYAMILILAEYVNKGCDHPHNPEYGHCDVSGKGYGAKATYRCNDGYQLYGKHHVRKCLKGGYWSGKAPLCKKIGKLKNITSCK